MYFYISIYHILINKTESSCFTHLIEHHCLLFQTVINFLAILSYKKLNKMGSCISKDSANAKADDEIVDHETKSISKDYANAEADDEIVDHETKGE